MLVFLLSDYHNTDFGVYREEHPSHIEKRPISSRTWVAWELFYMAPEVGFEPTTLRLTVACSTIELLRNVRYRLFRFWILSEIDFFSLESKTALSRLVDVIDFAWLLSNNTHSLAVSALVHFDDLLGCSSSFAHSLNLIQLQNYM